jgi:hypothetical protein
MADVKNTVLDNSANDYAKRAAETLNGVGVPMFQQYKSDKVDVKEMFGKFNQKNAVTGMQMSGEKRKK